MEVNLHPESLFPNRKLRAKRWRVLKSVAIQRDDGRDAKRIVTMR